MLEIVGRRLRDAEARLETLAFKNISARLAALLLRLQQNNCVDGQTHQDLAEMIGTYRETVTQMLNDFKSRGMIAIQRKRIEILDAPRLERLADE